MEGARRLLVDDVVNLLSRGRSVGVLGEAGIGKTTLLNSIATAVAAPGCDREVIRTGGLQSLRTTPWILLKRAIGRQIDDNADPAEVSSITGDAILIVDDAQWADSNSLAAMRAHRGPLVFAIRRDDPGESSARLAITDNGGSIVSVTPLTDDEAVAAAQDLAPTAGPATIDAIVRSSGGNPSVLQQMALTGSLQPTLSAALRERVAGLAPLQVQVLALARFAGDVSLGALSESAANTVTGLVDAGLLTQIDGVIRCRLDVCGDAAIDNLGPSERHDVHLRVASITTDPMQRASHLLAAGSRADALTAALESVEACSGTVRVVAALELAARCSSGAQRSALYDRTIDEALDHGDLRTARRLVESEIALRSPMEPADLARAAEVYARDCESTKCLEAVSELDEVADDRVRTRGLAARSLALVWPEWRVAESLTEAERAWASGGGRTALEQRSLGTALLASGGDGWHAHASSMGPLARTAGRLLEAQPQGEPAEGLAGLVDRFHRSAECDALAPHLTEAMATVDQKASREVARAHLAVALADSGRTSLAAAIAAEGLADEPTPAGEGLLTWALAEAELAAGRLRGARKAVDRLTDRHEPSPWSALAGLVSAWAAADAPRGDVSLITTSDSQWAVLAAAPIETDALIARSGNRLTEAEDMFAAAASAWSGVHRRGELRCRWASADVALRMGRRDESIERLQALEVEAAALGQRPVVARIRTSLRQAGVRRRVARRDGVGPLSAREVEVLELVRLGMTTSEVSRSLGIAGSTVDTQVESAMRKLSARTRIQAASMLAELMT